MYENEMKSGYPVNYDPDYAYDDENMPVPAQEPDEQSLAFQKEIEEREAFMQEHMTLPDGTTDLTTFGWTSLRRLMCKELPSIRYIVDGLLPQGLAILASPPKYGKSWLALDLCISVALGEPFFGRKTEPCDTLYLALEDSEQRLQARGQTVLGDRLPPENCYIGTLAGSLADRLPHQIEAFLRRWPGIGKIVIDTFQKVRVSARAGS
ncbi:MAG: AAA family ATPase, partial [Butyricicoccus sp.]